jgi:hypothetical protein
VLPDLQRCAQPLGEQRDRRVVDELDEDVEIVRFAATGLFLPIPSKSSNACKLRLQ